VLPPGQAAQCRQLVRQRPAGAADRIDLLAGEAGQLFGEGFVLVDMKAAVDHAVADHQRHPVEAFEIARGSHAETVVAPIHALAEAPLLRGFHPVAAFRIGNVEREIGKAGQSQGDFRAGQRHKGEDRQQSDEHMRSCHSRDRPAFAVKETFAACP
jgi:hypothetical protein